MGDSKYCIACRVREDSIQYLRDEISFLRSLVSNRTGISALINEQVNTKDEVQIPQEFNPIKSAPRSPSRILSEMEAKSRTEYWEKKRKKIELSDAEKAIDSELISNEVELFDSIEEITSSREPN